MARSRQIPLPATRGNIVDRNGKRFAVTTHQYMIVADPTMIKDPKGTALELANILREDAAKVLPKLLPRVTAAGKPDKYEILRKGLEPQCVKAFNIWGVQTTTSLDDCAIDLFGEGSPKRSSLAQFFQDAEHTRLMWWPQKGVDRMEVWKARTIPPEPGFVPHPYEEFPLIGSGQFAEKIGGVVLRLFCRWILPGLLGGITRFFLRTLYPFIVRLFEPVDGKEGPELFQDSWWHGLPMDNEANDQLMPIHFTEVWIPVERCREVMLALRNVYAENGIWASGTTSTEIYPTPASKFWMSPAYQRDVVKIDVFWFGANKGDPIALFYPQFWNALKPFGFRAHWAKYLPFKPDAPTEWLDYLRPQYPRWNDFMALRARMDPAQVFVTDYWRTHLGIPPRQAEVS